MCQRQIDRVLPAYREPAEFDSLFSVALGRMTNRPAPGYSGTPLARKLGIVAGKRIHAKNEPREYKSWLDPMPAQVVFQEKPSAETDLVHIFVDKKAELSALLPDLRKKLKSEAAVWISWPKKAAKVPTDITEESRLRSSEHVAA